jgi:hypothetical protein
MTGGDGVGCGDILQVIFITVPEDFRVSNLSTFYENLLVRTDGLVAAFQ